MAAGGRAVFCRRGPTHGSGRPVLPVGVAPPAHRPVGRSQGGKPKSRRVHAAVHRPDGPGAGDAVPHRISGASAGGGRRPGGGLAGGQRSRGHAGCNSGPVHGSGRRGHPPVRHGLWSGRPGCWFHAGPGPGVGQSGLRSGCRPGLAVDGDGRPSGVHFTRGPFGRGGADSTPPGHHDAAGRLAGPGGDRRGRRPAGPAAHASEAGGGRCRLSHPLRVGERRLPRAG